jgi:tRNA nucleotidyltransferase/poly(A) polymerase
MFKCLKFTNKLTKNNLFKKMESTQNLDKDNLSSSLSHYPTSNLFLYPYIKPTTLSFNIQLNQKESQIFQIITSILKKHNKATICRVAGGWVRDKLLNRKNDDIDIALDDMSGESLAKLINEELYPGDTKAHFGVVSQNCEKSKHLETATMRILDTFVDFVNLRSEKYTENSRVPIIDIGTPEEDARRRDITINSMFYNINTNTVEDFLNQGIQDLQNGFIRTPLNPEVTFHDDPLRILRVVRFAVRFQFNLDEEIYKAIKKTEIKNSLYKKISNERIAKELSLMLEGNKPQCAVYLLYKFKLIDAIMKLPLNDENLEKNQNEGLEDCINLVMIGSYIFERFISLEGNLLKNENEGKNENFEKMRKNLFFNKYYFYNTPKMQIDEEIQISPCEGKHEHFQHKHDPTQNQKELKKLFFLNLLTLPFKDYKIKINKEILRASVIIIRESLKYSNDYIKEISILHDNIEMLSLYINQCHQCNNLEVSPDCITHGTFDRLSSARLIRKIKSQYIFKLGLLAICNDYLKHIKHVKIVSTENENIFYDDGVMKYIDETVLNSIVGKYQNWFEFLEKENLLNVDTLEPIIKGDSIVELIKVRGKDIGVLIELLVEKQILEKNNFTREEAIEFLNEKKKELNLGEEKETPKKSNKKVQKK